MQFKFTYFLDLQMEHSTKQTLQPNNDLPRQPLDDFLACTPLPLVALMAKLGKWELLRPEQFEMFYQAFEIFE